MANLLACNLRNAWQNRIPFLRRVIFYSNYISPGSSEEKIPTPPDLKTVLEKKIPERIEMVHKLRIKHGSSNLHSLTVDMLYAGLREAPVLISETTTATSKGGIHFSGLTVREARHRLPHALDGVEPLPEAMLWLLLTGEVPSAQQTASLSQDLVEREKLPVEVLVAMRHLPPEMDPVPQLSAGLLALSERSKFAVAARSGMHSHDLWEPMLEDVLDLIAVLPSIVALVLQSTRGVPQDVPPVELGQDWTTNLSQKMGFYDHRLDEFLRLFLSIHCDYETSNVATHSATLLGSALADPYIAIAASTLAYHTPRHGRCQINALEFLQRMGKSLIPNPPEEKLITYLKDHIQTYGCIPGFGHSVHRITDPRYSAQQEFCETHLLWHPLVMTSSRVAEVAPPLLQELARVRHPTPNSQLASAPALYALGITESSFHPVLAAASRALGAGAALVWSRALRQPLERPRAVSTDDLWRKYDMY